MSGVKSDEERQRAEESKYAAAQEQERRKHDRIEREIAITLARADGFNPHDLVVPVDTEAAYRFPNGRRALYHSADATPDYTVPLWSLYRAEAGRLLRGGVLPPMVTALLDRVAYLEGDNG